MDVLRHDSSSARDPMPAGGLVRALACVMAAALVAAASGFAFVPTDAHGQEVAVLTLAYAQERNLDMNLEVSDEEKTIIFAGFAAAVIVVFVVLARDVILRRKTEYDSNEYESKKEKTYEKYHSDWTDDYEEVGTRKKPGRSADEEWDEVSRSGGSLPDYYGILGVSQGATNAEIKEAFRGLAKELHPDRIGRVRAPARKEASDNGSDSPGAPDGRQGRTMAEINEAYEVLSDKDLRKKYDLRMGL